MPHLTVMLGREVIQHHKEQIKSREQRVGQVDVFGDADGVIVGAIQRIGCGQNTAACVQRHLDARFGDRYGLLLHHLYV